MSLLRRSFLGILLSACCSCIALPVAHAPAERIDVPETVASYTTDATPGGVVGGARAESLARDVATELTKRGADALPDGALAAAASWMLRELNDSRAPGVLTTDAAARRFGFAGLIVALAGFGLNDSHASDWRTALEQVPANVPVTRFGVSVSDSGRSAAVVFGATELSLRPFVRHPALSDRIELRGEIGERFRSSHVYLTKTDGSVEERRMPTRKIDTTFSFAAAGVYQLEVMGDGPTGPVVVANVPLYVGVEEPKPAVSTGRTTAPAESEARMLELLNEARSTAHLEALRADDELRQIALGHSTDMVEHGFFGHVSPITGTPEDRMRRSGVVLANFGENVAQADDAETAHDVLMASPGHRANMLGPNFTHVGIAAVQTEARQLAFTLVFGRRANPATMPRTAEQVEAALLSLRRKNKLSLPTSDSTYRVGARAGVTAYVASSAPTLAVAAQAQAAAMTREVQRTHSSRPATCALVIDLVELEQLDKMPQLLDPKLRRFGIGAQLREDSHGSRLVVMMLLEGIKCQ